MMIAIVTIALLLNVVLVAAAACPCADARLCAPIAVPLASRKELFVFADFFSPVWPQYNFTKLTTLAVFNRKFGDPPAPFLCRAHAHDVRVVHLVNFDPSILLNVTARAAWVRDVVSDCSAVFCDGLNIDFEASVDRGSAQSAALTRMVDETCTALHRANAHASCTFDVAWNAGGVDGRFFDYAGIANSTDFVFIMSYDTRSQLTLAECVAGANSPTTALVRGIKSFTAIGVDNFIVGLPWYGYRYQCLPGHSARDSSACKIPPVPYAGAPCSDASGSEHPYAEILALLDQGENATAVRLQASTHSLEFNWLNGTDVFEFWFDDARTLASKFAVAKSFQAKGVGVWTIDMAPYTSSKAATNEMWNAFDAFLD